MNALSLFSGCGALDLALERAGIHTVAMCERDAACRAVLARHWPGVPVYADVREVAADTAGGGRAGWPPDPERGDAADGPSPFGVEGVGAAGDGARLDLVCGGFPCQPVSQAGRGLAQADPRWLWPEMARIVRALRPRHVLVENVPGLLDRGLGIVVGDLAEAGYDAEWFSVRASDFGAPHRRERIFVVATDADRARREGREHAGRLATGRREAAADAERERLHRGGGANPQSAAGEGPDGRRESPRREAPTAWGAYAPAVERWERALGRPAPAPTDDRGRLAPEFVEWMMGLPAGWTEGVSRTQRLKMLGNAVHVQTGEYVGRFLHDA